MATVAENREQLAPGLARVGISLPIGTRDHAHLQRILAPALRAAAIAHLRSGSGPVSENFRETYIFVGGNDDFPQEAYADFLDHQAKPGVWATYYEAIALGELLNINIVTSKPGSEPVVQYKAGENRPLMHLYLINDNHWTLDPRDETKILDDGNCLYNATAVWLERAVAPQFTTALADSTKALHTFWDKVIDRIITNARQDAYIQSLIQRADATEAQLKQLCEFRNLLDKMTVDQRKKILDQVQATIKDNPEMLYNKASLVQRLTAILGQLLENLGWYKPAPQNDVDLAEGIATVFSENHQFNIRR